MKRKTSRLLSFLLALCMVLFLLPSGVMALGDVEFDLAKGNITIKEEDGSIIFTQNGTDTPVPDGRAHITQSGSGVTKNYIEVHGGEVFLTIWDLNIEAAWPFEILPGAKLTLELAGENIMRSTGKYDNGEPISYPAAGMCVPSEAVLKIVGDGSLTAYGSRGGAGIGGGGYYHFRDGSSSNCGTIIIESGSVSAYGGESRGGAGIGGAGADSHTYESQPDSGISRGGIVIINGGTVTAVGGSDGAGMGGAGIGGGGLDIYGKSGDGYGGILIVTSGTVNASGAGAGIGGGNGSNSGGNGGYVTVTGGAVTASSSGTYSAGIGGGGGSQLGGGNGGTVIITGGDVTASGGRRAFDIGPGGGSLVSGSPCERITIRGTADVKYSTKEGTTVDKWQSAVSIEANNGSGTVTTETVGDGLFYTLPENTFIHPAGSVFKAWSIDGEEYAPGEWYFVTGDTVVKAIWEAAATSYTVTFDPNGGEVSLASKTVTNGGTYGELPTPTRSGYRFEGWFTSAGSGTQITSGTTVDLTADQTLYAHWAKVTEGDPVIPEIETEEGPHISTNKGYNAYVGNWAANISSYLFANGSGGLTRVEVVTADIGYLETEDGWELTTVRPGYIQVEDYDSDFNFLGSRAVRGELTYWGGFFPGEKYNFLVFGQENLDEDDGQEVIRVVKYSKDWERLGQASLYGANTTVPFDAGSLRFAEYGGMLYIRTSHEMYTSAKDGKNHQANLTLAVREGDMKVTDSAYEVAFYGCNYVSHSFNQFILVDRERRIVAVDHGDAYPRAIVLSVFGVKAGAENITSGSAEEIEILEIPGQTGENVTGACVGGLAETANGYVVAYNYDGTGTRAGARYHEVYLAYVDKDTHKVTTKKLSGSGTYPPTLVSTGLDGGYIMWNTSDSSGYVTDTLYYAAYYDGGAVGEVHTANIPAVLSDCQPIVRDGKVVWYTTDQSVPTFYMLDGNGVSAKKAEWEEEPHNFSGEWTYDGVYHWHACTDPNCGAVTGKKPHNLSVITRYPTTEKDGSATATCRDCGYTKTKLLHKLGHNFSDTWSFDETGHWYACTDPSCEERSGEAGHIWDKGEETAAPDYDKEGSTTYTCTVCGYTRVENIPKLEPAFSLKASIAGDGGVSYTVSSTSARAVYVAAALYSGGKLQEIKMNPFTTKQGESVGVMRFTAAPGSRDFVKVFLLDRTTYTPLCPAVPLGDG